MILEDPKPRSTSSAPSSPFSAAPPPSESSPLLPHPAPSTSGRTASTLRVDRDGTELALTDEDERDAPPPYEADVKSSSSATRRARLRLLKTILCALAFYVLASLTSSLGWAVARGGGRPDGRKNDPGPPPFGPNAPLHRPLPAFSHPWNLTQSPLPPDRHGRPLYCNPLSSTTHPTSEPASVFLVPITTNSISIAFHDDSFLPFENDGRYPEPNRSVSSSSSVTFLPWTEGVEEEGQAIKVVVEGLLKGSGTWSNHQVCMMQVGGGPEPDEGKGRHGGPPPDDKKEQQVPSWRIALYASEFETPPALRIIVYVPVMPLSAPLRRPPDIYVGRFSGEFIVGELANVNGEGRLAFASLMLAAETEYNSRKIKFESLSAEKIILVGFPVDNVHLGNLTVTSELFVSLEDSAASIDGHLQLGPGSQANVHAKSGRIDLSVSVLEIGVSSVASSPSKSLPAILEPVQVGLYTNTGNQVLNIPVSDPRIPLVLQTETLDGVMKVTLPRTFQGALSVTSSLHSIPILNPPATSDLPVDPFHLTPPRSFYTDLQYTGRFAIVGHVGWAASNKPFVLDAGFERAGLDLRVREGGSGAGQLTLTGKSEDPDRGLH